MGNAAPAAVIAAPVRAKVSRDDWLLRGVLVVVAALLVVSILLPLYALLSKSFHNADGKFIGFANYQSYFANPALFQSIENSVTVTAVATVITVVLVFLYAYGLTRTCMPYKSLFKGIALIPILMPSLLPAISLVYFFGNQGVIKGLLMGETIYGPIGIVMGEAFYIFPHIMTILLIAMSMSDARLYEAASALGASRTRTFFTVTLPGVRYGLVSAFFVAFTLIITDFGVPKVIGGQYNVLATDVYK
ncbi:MAG: ABC transporter permease subunit, partial [Rhodospirillales bacterium]